MNLYTLDGRPGYESDRGFPGYRITPIEADQLPQVRSPMDRCADCGCEYC